MILDQAHDADDDAIVALWERCDLTRPWNDSRGDLRLARAGATSAVLTGRESGVLVATVMVGFDGHRGWVYYLAVDPYARGRGLGRAMMAAAEAWLRERGAPKLQLMVRDENAGAAAFYERLGYQSQPVRTLGKWLKG